MIDNSEQLKKIRKENSLTIQAVSNGSGIPIRTYQNYEYGKREISAEALCKLSDFYGVSVDYLLGREKPKEPDVLTKLTQMFQLSELEKALLQVYIAISPEERGKFIETIEEVVRQKKLPQDTTKQQNSKPDIQVSQNSGMAIARSKGNPFREPPTPEQIAGFKPVPEDSGL